ncbi:DUF1617 family protein [Clostridium perfringens]|uniref:DUF1617 family protein n=1 Tax=Clostridium perfringens (strain ATCC 13124 / DSM 756 / JCM 1290 / NCIMB 6125 / NCTC 8237 / Type A) TaxID=195103 RepID=A0A0H2YS71_CLOP1|nr:DUF1617 family protein [Clostridium perfringens]DAL50746.1 MAG TPA_asm: Protein of unknown function (DUF1617) [Caudoviricetes sp.]ABG83882.1 conserved hypothetical protein [Clostridium perfringens ATCC 13124]MDM0884979.1 DUF1617 family protein [Clostridium perfringens]MDU1016187.1 DUF1617 family protein [Clostridium perfringens]MDU2747968.1 DUF1617 family protein [Clostridium perfringens]
MVKMTNKEILEKVNVLGEISLRKLPVKVSYAIGKNISKVERELKHYNKERQKLIEEYCLKEDDGTLKITDGNYDIDPERLEYFNKEINELQEIEVEMNIHKFNIELLNGYEMSPGDLMCIDFMIEE